MYDEVRRIDPDIANVLDAELARQRNQLEMIASENFTSRAVMETSSQSVASDGKCRASSSQNTAAVATSAPLPPNSIGTDRPIQLISAKRFHSERGMRRARSMSRMRVSGSSRSKKRRTLSRSRSCSRIGSKFMLFPEVHPLHFRPRAHFGRSTVG